MNVIVDEFPCVGAAVCPVKLTRSMLLAIMIGSFIVCAVRPYFFSLPMLLVFEPVAFILGSISMVVPAFSMGFVVFPIAVVDVTVGMNETATAISFV